MKNLGDYVITSPEAGILSRRNQHLWLEQTNHFLEMLLTNSQV
jgi:hypothetical protein